MRPRKAVHFGVVIDLRTNKAVRIFNPDFEWEFAFHHVAPHEQMVLRKKSRHHVSRKRNAMALSTVAQIFKEFNGAA